jgi:hypothetical protein
MLLASVATHSAAPLIDLFRCVIGRIFCLAENNFLKIIF